MIEPFYWKVSKWATSAAPCEQADYMQEVATNIMLPGMIIEFMILLRTDFRRKW